MRMATGRWVSGEDFFNREDDLVILKQLVGEHNHVLLTGQRRMGKTSVVQELGRQLMEEDWLMFFCDVEGATRPEDVIAELAAATQPVRPISSKVVSRMKRFFGKNVEEISAFEFRIKVRAGLDEQNWRWHGEQLFRDCAAQSKRVLLAIDELPVFLKRLLNRDPERGAHRVDEFLSWLRGAVQKLGRRAPVLLISGSIGLQPLVCQLGLTDRINHLYPYRLQPWDSPTSIRCLERLAQGPGMRLQAGVAEEVYNLLGLGVPHHIQSFFARLRDFAVVRQQDHVTVQDVRTVYRTQLLGPSGQIDLAHYESRLREALQSSDYEIALRILAESAIRGVFSHHAQNELARQLPVTVADKVDRITGVLDVLEHDGYLVSGEAGHEFSFQLLKDWFAARFKGHYTPLDDSGS